MSRQATIAESLVFHPTGNTGSSRMTVTNSSSGYAGTSNTSQYASLAPTSSTNNGYTYFTFSITGLPSDATITSVACDARLACQAANTLSTSRCTIQLYNGTTAQGASTSFNPSTTSAVTTIASTGSSWTTSNISNVRLRVNGRKSSSSAASIRFYGADLTVNYNTIGTEYEVSIENNSSTVTTLSPSDYVAQGRNHTINFFNIDDLNSISVTDNNTDVTSSLVYSSVLTKEEQFFPSSFSNSSGTVTNQSNGLTGTDSNTYAQLTLKSGSYIEYSFNTSSIPNNATINSVSCQAKGCVTRTSNAATVQLYSGSTAKGSTTNLSTNSTVTIVNLNCGTWTRSELNDCRIRIVSTYTSNNTYYANFYGADLIVNYTINEDHYTYTISNISADHTIVIEDVSTGFVLTCTDNSTLGDITPTGTQSVEEGDDVVYSLSSSDFSLIKLTDNGVDVTSQIVHSQSSGSGSPVFIPSSYYTEKPNGESGYVADGITNGNNGLNNTSNNSPATLYSLEHGGYEWASFHISVSGIPEGAIIDSVTCKVKVRYLLSGVAANDNKVQLYSGNTPKGTATILSGTTTFNDYLDIGTWTLEELQDVRLYVCGYGRQVSQGSDFMYFYGAELTVTYHSIAGHTYTISNVSAPHTLVLSDQPYYVLTCTDNSTNGNIVPTGTRNVVEGGTAVYTLTSSDFNTIKLKDNGVDVTNQIVYSSTTSSGSPMFVPSSFDLGGFTSSSDLNNGYSAVTNYNSATLTTDGSTTCSCAFIISVTGVPTGSIIDSVSCKIRISKAFNDNMMSASIQLYSGNTPKGTAHQVVGSNQVNTRDLDTGTWTVEELQNVRLVISGEPLLSHNNANIYFYGAEFTVTYHSTQGYTYNILNVSAPHTIVLEDSNDRVYIKVNGSFVQVNAVYKKINGVWVEQSDMSSLFDNNHIYVTG